MRTLAFILFTFVTNLALAQSSPFIDQTNLKADTDKKAAIAAECPNLKGVQLASCVSKAGLTKRFTKRGTIAYAESAYGKLSEQEASKKLNELEALVKQCRSNVFARELVPGELFREDVEREISWIETNRLAAKRRYQFN